MNGVGNPLPWGPVQFFPIHKKGGGGGGDNFFFLGIFTGDKKLVKLGKVFFGGPFSGPPNFIFSIVF